jgi:hypothetical protein
LNNERLCNHKERIKLYREAVKYIRSVWQALYEDYSEDKCTDDEKILYMISLHNNNYFDSILLPDEALILGMPNTIKSIEMIAQVYGKYFLFYDYLQNTKKKLESTPDASCETCELFAEDQSNDVIITTLYDMLLPEHKDKRYLQIVSLLSREFDKKELKIYKKIKKPLFTIIDGDIKKLKLNSFHGKYSCLGALLIYLNREKWIREVPSSRLFDIANKIFGTNIKDHSLFSKINSHSNNSAYMEDIELLFMEIK